MMKIFFFCKKINFTKLFLCTKGRLFSEPRQKLHVKRPKSLQSLCKNDQNNKTFSQQSSMFPSGHLKCNFVDSPRKISSKRSRKFCSISKKNKKMCSFHRTDFFLKIPSEHVQCVSDNLVEIAWTEAESFCSMSADALKIFFKRNISFKLFLWARRSQLSIQRQNFSFPNIENISLNGRK